MHWPDDVAARYRAAGYWRGETFGGMLRDLAARYGSRPALISGATGTAATADGTPGPATRWSFRDLDERADRLAAGLYGSGIRGGDRVVVQLPNVPEFHQVCFALFRLGAWPVFALPGHRSAEISYFCEFTGAAAYICPDDAHRAYAPGTPRSRSTGSPRPTRPCSTACPARSRRTWRSSSSPGAAPACPS
nr:hypothetical protein GCM10020093_049870 [Planobispora longispora]